MFRINYTRNPALTSFDTKAKKNQRRIPNGQPIVYKKCSPSAKKRNTDLTLNERIPLTAQHNTVNATVICRIWLLSHANSHIKFRSSGKELLQLRDKLCRKRLPRNPLKKQLFRKAPASKRIASDKRLTMLKKNERPCRAWLRSKCKAQNISLSSGTSVSAKPHPSIRRFLHGTDHTLR